jgi:DNA-binding transcriptional LysR family regulator
MNIHHLELFYFVAKHGGIAAAVRNIPYGIQQPAVSGQIAKLEESLGIKLFQRRPFALSPAGAELFEFIKPFFDNIDIVAERLRQNSSPQLRIAAPSIVLHDYLPQILECLRLKFPAFRLYLHEAARAEAERLLLARDVDLAIMLIDKKSRAGIQVRPLLELPLILLVHKKSKLARAEELWKRDKIEETLVSFPRTDPVHAYFQRGLERLGVEWFCGTEVNSARLIERYVASGYGIGLAIDRTLRCQRVRHRFGRRGAGLQATTTTARSSTVALPAGSRRCCMVRQTFRHRAPATGRARH